MLNMVLDLINSYGSNEPRNIASKLNIKVFYKRMPVGVSGVLINPEIKKAIIINSRLSRRQQRVALAHELGHALLHSEYDLYGALDSATRAKLEIDANTFAHLLLNKGAKHEKERCN
jgi:Zn-dependent peptidase ImmA (M78 family)